MTEVKNQERIYSNKEYFEEVSRPVIEAKERGLYVLMTETVVSKKFGSVTECYLDKVSGCHCEEDERVGKVLCLDYKGSGCVCRRNSDGVVTRIARCDSEGESVRLPLIGWAIGSFKTELLTKEEAEVLVKEWFSKFSEHALNTFGKEQDPAKRETYMKIYEDIKEEVFSRPF